MWITFVVVVVLYLALGVTTILVLREMSRRFRRAGGFDRARRARTAPSARPSSRDPVEDASRRHEHAVAVVLFLAVTAYAVFGGADFGAGFWDLIAGGAERGATSAAR